MYAFLFWKGRRKHGTHVKTVAHIPTHHTHTASVYVTGGRINNKTYWTKTATQKRRCKDVTHECSQLSAGCISKSSDLSLQCEVVYLGTRAAYHGACLHLLAFAYSFCSSPLTCIWTRYKCAQLTFGARACHFAFSFESLGRVCRPDVKKIPK